MKRWALFIGLLLLFLPDVLRVYFIMPFPGSQKTNTVAFAYSGHFLTIGNTVSSIEIRNTKGETRRIKL